MFLKHAYSFVSTGMGIRIGRIQCWIIAALALSTVFYGQTMLVFYFASGIPPRFIMSQDIIDTKVLWNGRGNNVKTTLW